MTTGQLHCLWRSEPFGLTRLAEASAALADHLDWGDVVALQAPMGTGKTTLVAAMARHYGAEDAASSPTFALSQSYPVSQGPASRIIRHLDLYRIRSEEELTDLGWEELMDDGEALTFVEWPERAADHFPDHARLLRMERLPDGMRVASLWERESA